MKEFQSWTSYHQFKERVKRYTRSIYDSDVYDFLQTVLETSNSRSQDLKEGSPLWRARLGCQNIDNTPYPYDDIKDMIPPMNNSSEGRGNPKGIRYLYLSTHCKTAMSEVKPWMGSYISLAKFTLSKTVKLINCTSDDSGEKVYFIEPTPEKKEISVWRDIDIAFSTPLSWNDKTLDYVPTQIIAELFKKNGFDGIAYRSSLGEGHNIMLFDLNTISMVSPTLLFETYKIVIDFNEVPTNAN